MASRTRSVFAEVARVAGVARVVDACGSPEPGTVCVDVTAEVLRQLNAPGGAEASAEEIPAEEPAEDYASSEPPEPEYEEPPAAPAAGDVWIPGWWSWVNGEWRWASGRWTRPVVGRSYVAPYFEVAGGRVVVVRGYWGVGQPPERSYGGVRVKLARPTRPPDYRPGAAPAVRVRAGVAIGTRGQAAYVPAGPARTAPQRLGPTGASPPQHGRPATAPPTARAPTPAPSAQPGKARPPAPAKPKKR